RRAVRRVEAKRPRRRRVLRGIAQLYAGEERQHALVSVLTTEEGEMKGFQIARKVAAGFAAALLVGSAWGQGTAKPGVLTIGFIPAEDSRAMVRQSQAILD